jgi:hypothetical protein
VTTPPISQIIGPLGPVSSGSGPQNNTIVVPWTFDSRQRSPRRQAADLRELAQRFVHPAGFGKARNILRDRRTVFLYAPAGSGRTAAAKLLLRELASPDTTFYELLLQEKDHHHRPIEFSHIGEGEYAWLDLTDTGGWSPSEIRNEFPELLHTVRKQAAHLVAILPDQAWRFDPEIMDYCAPIDRPPLDEVLQRHLRMGGFPASDSLHELEFTRQNGPLRDVPQYVRLISEARDRAAGKNDFADWCASAYRALTGREPEVRELIAKLTDGPQRALLLTVAMLHGAHADVIEQAATSLLEKVKQPPDDCSLLERAALDEKLHGIEAERDYAGNVRFKVLGFDSAVRSYFWTHMSGIRKPLQDWLDDVIDSPVLGEADRGTIVRNFAEQCLNDRYKPILARLAEKYVSNGKRSDSRMIAAAQILHYGLQAEHCGRFFRREIYEWSRRDGMSDELAAVIVAACRDEISATHPDEALVRLHHVARRKSGYGAYQTLVELVSADRRFLRQMLGRLTDREPDARKWAVDLRLFLSIANPRAFTDPGPRNHALIADAGVSRQLTAGWNLIFAGLEHEEWAPNAYQWLRCASEDYRHRHALLDVLIHGAEQRPSALARLYVMTRRAEFREVISGLVLEKITIAQGVDSAGPQR